MNKVNQMVLLNLVDEIAISLTAVENGHARDALASLYELRLMIVAEGIVTNGSTHDVLPNMIDPATGAPKPMRVKTIQVACPTCLAKPQQNCFRMSGRGQHGTPTTEPLVMGDGKRSFHKRRTQLAKARST